MSQQWPEIAKNFYQPCEPGHGPNALALLILPWRCGSSRTGMWSSTTQRWESASHKELPQKFISHILAPELEPLASQEWWFRKITMALKSLLIDPAFFFKQEDISLSFALVKMISAWHSHLGCSPCNLQGTRGFPSFSALIFQVISFLHLERMY